jgi:hypothetical protein
MDLIRYLLATSLTGPLAVASPLACGGVMTAAVGDASATDGTNRDAGTTGDVGTTADAGTLPDAAGVDGSMSSACPASVPSIGAACGAPRSGLQCEYGQSYWPNCDVVVQCDATTLTWTGVYDGANCSFGTTMGCPAAYAGLPRTVCSAPQADCDYAEGHCACAVSCGGPPPLPDAGPSWICNPTPPGCPGPRSRYGDPCATEGQSCAYGLCCTSTMLTCTGGHWHGVFQNIACP